jgi:hypothetical protein
VTTVRLVAFLLLAGCKGCAPEPEPLLPSVMVLVLDGVRADELSRVETSALTGMSGEAYAAETWETLAVHATIVRAALNQRDDDGARARRARHRAPRDLRELPGRRGAGPRRVRAGAPHDLRGGARGPGPR